jgi:LysM repeat protein
MASTHKVVKGDTLSAIAKRYKITLAQLIKLNPQITNPNLIRVGQVVNISAATSSSSGVTADDATSESVVTGSSSIYNPAPGSAVGGPGVGTQAEEGGPGSATDNTASVDGALAAFNAYGLTLELLKIFPDLLDTYDAFIRGDLTQAKLNYFKSSYYKNVTETGQERAKTRANRRGVYDQEFEAYLVAQKSRMVGIGITDEKVLTKDFFEKAYLSGWTDKQLDLNALGGTTKPLTGGALGNTQILKQYADAFGMSYNALTYDIWTKSLAAGTMAEDDIKAKMRQDSASAFPVFADQINAGKTLDSLASAYKTSIANILEKDPDTVSWTDPNLRKALQNIDKDGKPILMPIWQFEKNLRSTTEWEYTNNARDTMDTLSLKVLRDWGLA